MRIRDVILDKISGEWGTEDVDGKGVKVLRTTNFSNDGRLSYANVATRVIPNQLVGKKRLLRVDVIIEKSGGSPTQPVGRVVFFDNDEDIFLCNNFTNILRPSNKIFPRYFFYDLFYKHLSKRTLKYQNKTTGIINLQLNRYLDEDIKVPSLNEQRKIVKFLDTADSLRQKRKEQLTLLDNYLKSVFLDMFGDPLTNNKGITQRKIGDLGEVVTGNTPSRQKKEYYGDFIEWIKSDNINRPEFILTKAEEFLSEAGVKVGRIVSEGAILVTCIAGSPECIGNCAISDRKVAFNQQINAFVPGDEIKTEFFFAQLYICKKLVQEASTESMKGMVSKGRFSEIKILIPSIDQQIEFVKMFKPITQMRQKMHALLDEMDNHFNALMQRYFG